MTNPFNPSIRRYTWRGKDGHHTPGVMLRNGGAFVFIPHNQLTTFADFMVDAHEQHEQETA